MRRGLCLFLAVLLLLIQGPFLGHTHPMRAGDHPASNDAAPHLHLAHLFGGHDHHDSEHEDHDEGGIPRDHAHAALNLPAALSEDAASPHLTHLPAGDLVALVVPACDGPTAVSPHVHETGPPPGASQPSCPLYLRTLSLRL